MVSSAVFDMIKNPRLTTNVHGTFAKNKAIKEAAEKRDTSPAEDLKLTADILWRSLCAEFFCSCCQDVLAAPVVLKCTHSFCGSCITECYNRCVQCDELPGLSCVVCQCPECRAPVQGHDWSYERAYDEAIMKRVRDVPECQMKSDYLERRSSFLEAEKARKSAEASAKAQPLPPALERIFGTSRSAGTEAHGEGGSWESGYGVQETFEAYMQPFVVFAVALAIVIWRYGLEHR
jgi:hypothetical protein